MNKKPEPEVLMKFGYHFSVYLPVSKATVVIEALSHGTYVEYQKYSDGDYLSHSTKPKDITVINNPQPIQTSIEEAAVVDIPLHKYLKEKGLPHD